MTHTTDAELAEFEAWARSRYPSIDLTRDVGDYSKALSKDYWSLWQASRRAQVVQPVIDAVPEAVEQIAVDRYKVVPSHESMFHRWAVVAGNGTQQLYIGREGECQNMARKFMGTFLDGAFVAMQNAAAPKPPEAAPVQMPEPAGWVDDGGMLFWTEDTPPDGENIYTEHQVRQLLATYGIT